MNKLKSRLFGIRLESKMSLLNWLCRILKKGIWVLGLVPLFLDYVSVYIPSKSIPPVILNLIRNGANWQFTGILVVIGFLASAFLIHRESEMEWKTERQVLQQHIDALQTNALNEAAIAAIARIGNDYVVKRTILGTATGKTNNDHIKPI